MSYFNPGGLLFGIALGVVSILATDPGVQAMALMMAAIVFVFSFEI